MPAIPLLGGLADVPHRQETRAATGSSTSSSTGRARPGGCRSRIAPSSRRRGPTGFPRQGGRRCSSTCRSPTRRRRSAVSRSPGASSPRDGRSATLRTPAPPGLADQRRLVDDVPHRPLELVADLEELTRRRAAAMRTLLDEEAWDAACIVFVTGPSPALPARVRPPRTSPPRAGRRVAGRRPRARRLPPARPRARDLWSGRTTTTSSSSCPTTATSPSRGPSR